MVRILKWEITNNKIYNILQKNVQMGSVQSIDFKEDWLTLKFYSSYNLNIFTLRSGNDQKA